MVTTVTVRGETIRIKGGNCRFSIDCLYPNNCAPMPKRLFAYTRFETHQKHHLRRTKKIYGHIVL